MYEKLTGACLCGNVTYELQPPYDAFWCCHCKMCQRNYGLYGVFVGVLRENIIVTGEENITWFDSSREARRGFCKMCGSPFAWDYHGAEHLHVLAGTIDELPDEYPRVHMCTANKSPAYTIDPDDRQFAEFPGADTVAKVIDKHG